MLGNRVRHLPVEMVAHTYAFHERVTIKYKCTYASKLLSRRQFKI